MTSKPEEEVIRKIRPRTALEALPVVHLAHALGKGSFRMKMLSPYKATQWVVVLFGGAHQYTPLPRKRRL